jgi:hypothetical protein
MTFVRLPNNSHKNHEKETQTSYVVYTKNFLRNKMFRLFEKELCEILRKNFASDLPNTK